MTEPLSRLPTLSRPHASCGRGGRRPHGGHAARAGRRASLGRRSGDRDRGKRRRGRFRSARRKGAHEGTHRHSREARRHGRKHALFMRLFQCGRPRKTAGPGHRGFARAAHRRHERLGPRARRPRTRQDPLLGGARRAPLGRGLRRQVRALLLADLRRPLSEKPPAEALRPARRATSTCCSTPAEAAASRS